MTKPIVRIHRIALLAALTLGTVSSVGCRVIEDSDGNREGNERAEERVEVNTLPLNVSAAVRGVMPTGVVTEAEKQYRRGKMVYSLDVKDGEKKYEVVVAPDGTILSTRQEGR